MQKGVKFITKKQKGAKCRRGRGQLFILPNSQLYFSAIPRFVHATCQMDTIAAYRRSRHRFSDAATTGALDDHSPPSRPEAVHRQQLPHSTASLGPTFRTRSLDHRRFSNLDTETRGSGLSRTFYASKPGGSTGRTYAPSVSHRKGELRNKKEERAQAHPRLSQANPDAYRSSSAERAGVTVVPIRRELTLPTRRSEWRTSEWESRSPVISQYEDRKKEGEEYTSFNRAVRYNHQRTVWPTPPSRETFEYDRKAGRMERTGEPRRIGTANLYYPDSATAEYSSRRSHQTGSDGAHREYFHNGHHQKRYHRTQREWHPGAESNAYGRNGMGQYQQQQQHYGRDGRGYYQQQQRFAREERGDMRNMGRGENGQHEYSNGWGGRSAHQHYSESYGGGHFEDDSVKARKDKGPMGAATQWTPSQRMPKEYASPKRYRRVHCCCFNLIWPPWAIVPSEPPRPMYGNGSAQTQRTYERNIPIELRTFDERREPFERNAARMHFNERRMSPQMRRSESIENHRRNPDQFQGQQTTDHQQRMRHLETEERSLGKWARRERENEMQT